MLIYGINPVIEALRAGRVTALRVGRRSDERVRAVLRLAEQRGVPVQQVDEAVLDRAVPRSAHQGIVGQPACRHYSLMGYILDPTVLVEETAPAIADEMRADDVDAVALVPA